MAVRKHVRARDGATVYYAVFRGPDGMQRVRQVRSVPEGATQKKHEYAETAARKYAQDARAAVESGTWVDPKQAEKITFGDLVKKFLKNYRTRSGSIVYYEQRSIIWLRHFGATRAAESITVRDVDRFKRLRLKQVNAGTVRQDLTSLSTLFRWARERRFLADNPADPDMVKRPSKPRPIPYPLTPEEEFALIEAASPALRPMIELALETGADRGELIALDWDRHVRRAEQLLTLPRAKTGIPRTIPYGANSRIRRIIREASVVRSKDSSRVFLWNGAPPALEAVKSAMRDAWGAVFPCRCADREGNPHNPREGCPTRLKSKPWKSLRATFATRKSEAGVDVPTLAALMGLTSAHVLEHYVKPSGRHLAAAMADRPSERYMERDMVSAGGKKVARPEGQARTVPGRGVGARDGARTHDHRSHNPGLYQLSYSRHGGAGLYRRVRIPSKWHARQDSNLRPTA